MDRYLSSAAPAAVSDALKRTSFDCARLEGPGGFSLSASRLLIASGRSIDIVQGPLGEANARAAGLSIPMGAVQGCEVASTGNAVRLSLQGDVILSIRTRDPVEGSKLAAAVLSARGPASPAASRRAPGDILTPDSWLAATPSTSTTTRHCVITPGNSLSPAATPGASPAVVVDGVGHSRAAQTLRRVQLQQSKPSASKSGNRGRRRRSLDIAPVFSPSSICESPVSSSASSASSASRGASGLSSGASAPSGSSGSTGEAGSIDLESLTTPALLVRAYYSVPALSPAALEVQAVALERFNYPLGPRADARRLESNSERKELLEKLKPVLEAMGVSQKAEKEAIAQATGLRYYGTHLGKNRYERVKTGELVKPEVYERAYLEFIFARRDAARAALAPPAPPAPPVSSVSSAPSASSASPVASVEVEAQSEEARLVAEARRKHDEQVQEAEDALWAAWEAALAAHSRVVKQAGDEFAQRVEALAQP